MKPQKIEVRFKHGIRYLSRKAADIACEHLGGIEIHPAEKPFELKNVPRIITEPVKVEPVLPDEIGKSEPEKVNQVASAMKPVVKAKRKAPVKSKTTKK